jgi:hypothetical protein
MAYAHRGFSIIAVGQIYHGFVLRFLFFRSGISLISAMRLHRDFVQKIRRDTRRLLGGRSTVQAFNVGTLK